MKRILFFFLLLVGMSLGMGVSAQVPKDSANGVEDGAPVFVETMPEFPGGQSALFMYLQKNIVYPSAASEAGIQGKVYIRFVVDVDGSITQVEVLRGVEKSLDDEALRVVKKMPNWKPGTQGGKPVKVYFNLPISFKLE